MRPLKGKVSITLDSDIIQTIRDYAEKDDRSFSQYINMVLKEYISRQGRTDETESCWCLLFIIQRKYDMTRRKNYIIHT